MPSINERIVFRAGVASDFNKANTKDNNSVYFCTDTKQIFVGGEEYTKGTGVLTSQPNETTQGDDGRLYAYNGNLYLCQYVDGTIFNWTRVANVNDTVGNVSSIGVGEGLDTTANSDNPITSTGTIVHAVPEGAQVTEDQLSDSTLEFGQSLSIESVETDKFGHVTSVNVHTMKLPESPLPKEVSVTYDSDTQTVTIS